MQRDGATEGDAADMVVDVGVLVVHSPSASADRIASFADRTTTDAADELEAATDVDWRFYAEEPERLADGDARRPSDFLDEALHRMVEGPYDVVVVVTDVALRSRRRRIVPGLASPVGRVVVISTRRLVRSPRGESVRSLDDASVRWNAATLLLHLLGHVLGARHRSEPGAVMAPFAFDPDRRGTPDFVASVERHLERIATDIPDDTVARGPFGRLAFHVRSAARNARTILGSLSRSRAPLLALSLPRLATAAVTPTLIVVFSAEAWDVGVHMTDGVAAAFGLASVLAATIYLVSVHDLFFPREPRRVLTEHMALVNVTAFCTVLAATIGLFVMVGLLMLVVELYVFPSRLITNWPTLEDPAVGTIDLVRTAAFISTIGLLTGALAGGLESRTVLRHLALFLDAP